MEDLYFFTSSLEGTIAISKIEIFDLSPSFLSLNGKRSVSTMLRSLWNSSCGRSAWEENNLRLLSNDAGNIVTFATTFSFASKQDKSLIWIRSRSVSRMDPMSSFFISSEKESIVPSSQAVSSRINSKDDDDAARSWFANDF